MKATLLADDLVRLAQLAARAADPHAIGAKRNVRIDADADALGVISYGGALAVMAQTTAEVHMPGTANVPADRLYELATKFDKGAVTVTLKDNLHVELRRGTRYLVIAGDHPNDAVRVPERPSAWTPLPRGALAVAIREVIYAAPPVDDQQLPQLKAVRVEVADGRLVAFATDRIRAACREVPLPGLPDALNGMAVTLPVRLCDELVRGMFGRLRKGDAELDAEGAGALRLDFGEGPRSVWLRDSEAGLTVMSPKLVSEYPAWRQLAEVYGPMQLHLAELDRAAWLDAVRALAAVDSRDGHDAVTLGFAGGMLTMTAQGTAESGGGDAVEARHADHPCGALVNARYLRDALARFTTERVAVRYGDPVVPVRVEPVVGGARAESWALTMPLVP